MNYEYNEAVQIEISLTRDHKIGPYFVHKEIVNVGSDEDEEIYEATNEVFVGRGPSVEEACLDWIKSWIKHRHFNFGKEDTNGES